MRFAAPAHPPFARQSSAGCRPGCLTRNSTLVAAGLRRVCECGMDLRHVVDEDQPAPTLRTTARLCADRCRTERATCGLQSQLPDARSISKVPMPLAASASRRRSSDARARSCGPFVSRSLSCMQPVALSHSPLRMALASLIARSLPSAICLGRWLNPHELVMIVCSGASQ